LPPDAPSGRVQNLRNDPDLGYTDKPTCDFSMPVQGDHSLRLCVPAPRSATRNWSGGQGETGATAA